MKTAYLEADETNQRFHALLEGVAYKPPLPTWDEHGVRVMSTKNELEVGDIEMKESRYHAIHLLHQISTGIVEVIRVFTGRPPMQSVLSPSMVAQHSTQTTPQIMPANAMQPAESIPFSEPFVNLILRYLIAIFDCGDLFQVDEARTKEQVQLRSAREK